MKIIIKTKIIELTPAIEEFINEKIGGLQKFVQSCHRDDEWERVKSTCDFFVEIEKETKHHRKGPYFKAEVKISLPGKTIVAAANNEDLRSAIVEVKDEMQQEMKKYKAKMIEAKRRELKKKRMKAQVI